MLKIRASVCVYIYIYKRMEEDDIFKYFLMKFYLPRIEWASWYVFLK